MSNIKGDANKRVFDNIEEINQKFGVDLKLPEHIPEGCNLLCYEIVDLYDVRFFNHYKLNDKLYHYVVSRKNWKVSNDSLELEVLEDAEMSNSKYAYLHLTQQEDDKPKFVPERLLGVETDRGHIMATEQDVVVCEGSGGWFVDGLRYYISDDSDETVSLDEYIKLFYNTENTL